MARTANCPTCRTPVEEEEKVAVTTRFAGAVRMRRYRCDCGWIWADTRQRRKNRHEYTKLLRRYCDS